MIAGASDYITEDSPWKTYPWQSWVHMLSDKHCMNVQLGNINTSVHGCSYYAPTEGKPYLEDARPDKESEYQILLGYTGDDNHMPADLFRVVLKKALTILHLAMSTRQALCKVCTWLMPDHLSLLAYRKQASMDLFSERLTRIVQRLGSYLLPAVNTSILRCACQVILQRMSWKEKADSCNQSVWQR